VVFGWSAAHPRLCTIEQRWEAPHYKQRRQKQRHLQQRRGEANSAFAFEIRGCRVVVQPNPLESFLADVTKILREEVAADEKTKFRTIVATAERVWG
jgi:hypothetical protein